MKGDIGMGWSSKKERTRSSFSVKPHKTTWHHPYIFVVDSDANKGQRYSAEHTIQAAFPGTHKTGPREKKSTVE